MTNLVRTLILILTAVGGAAERPPNVVIVMVDDMGYAGVSCFGNPHFKTPEIDQLAAEGMRFTDFHSNGVVCSPTRAALMTGRYQQRADVPGVINADPKHPDHARGIAPEHWTIAEALKSAGYATGIFGKWHLGYRPECNPTLHGFDRFIGFISGNIDYHSHYDRMVTFDWWHGTELNHEKGFQTDLSSDDAVEFIKENKNRPFFVYVPYGSPHSPNQGRASKIQRGPDKGKIPNYAPERTLTNKPGDPDWVIKDMIVAVDDGVGKIRRKLVELDLAQNTVFWFCSDNGGTGGNRTTGSKLRGNKGQAYEGGHRVPAIVWAPGRVKPGTVSNATVMTIDLTTTAIAQAGVTPPHPLDGIDLTPHLLEQKALPARELFWAMSAEKWAARQGDWKLVRQSGAVELFDLHKDLAESKNLAKAHPERVIAMTKAVTAWYADVTSGEQLDASNKPARSTKKKSKRTK
jgi:arylsulfatase A-like enzyme